MADIGLSAQELARRIVELAASRAPALTTGEAEEETPAGQR